MNFNSSITMISHFHYLSQIEIAALRLYKHVFFCLFFIIKQTKMARKIFQLLNITNNAQIYNNLHKYLLIVLATVNKVTTVANCAKHDLKNIISF